MLGAGGHATVLIDILRQLDKTILGVVARDKPEAKTVFEGIPCYESDDAVLGFDKEQIYLVNAIGSMPGNSLRKKIQQHFRQHGYRFLTVVSPKAMVSEFARLEEGAQVIHGAIVNAHSLIGEGTIVNSGAIIEHDCMIGRYNHIAPGAVLCGGVVSGNNVHIGTGASVIQSTLIGENVMVGAGSTVVSDLSDNSKHYVAKPFIC
ncbi:acetyltransferase [Lysobacter sp. N42]|nr:acetyltransferase [Aliidiomarina sp. B3213]TCZ91762.1 acetyltransferase [Lysobacter sp. N42]